MNEELFEKLERLHSLGQRCGHDPVASELALLVIELLEEELMPRIKALQRNAGIGVATH